MPTEEDVLAYVRDALAGGAGGVAMGRNIFQASDPRQLAAKVARLIHHFPEQHFAPLAFPADAHRAERLTPDHLDAPAGAPGSPLDHDTHHLSDPSYTSHPTGGPHHDGRKTVLA
jgi:2-amino-4,5-dihydroxy-6-oxo-7-(phosphonooxy)heptanoate synthase